MITKQELFDNTWNWHIVGRNPPGMTYDQFSGNSDCQYRTESGRRCAIGASIPDDMYKDDFEIMSLDVVFERVFGTPSIETFNFTEKLQNAHDYNADNSSNMSEFFESYEESLRRLAEQYGLTIPGEATEEEAR